MKKPEQILMEELQKHAGNLVAEFMIRQSDDEEIKKAIEANDFMIGLLKGDFKKEWKLEDTEDYKQVLILNRAIKLLTENK